MFLVTSITHTHTHLHSSSRCCLHILQEPPCIKYAYACNSSTHQSVHHQHESSFWEQKRIVWDNHQFWSVGKTFQVSAILAGMANILWDPMTCRQSIMHYNACIMLCIPFAPVVQPSTPMKSCTCPKQHCKDCQHRIRKWCMWELLQPC